MEDRARAELEALDREGLVVRAQAAGIRRARILTRPELIDELLRLDSTVSEAQLKKSRGFFGRARDLVARVVERGLHLPDAADRIRELAGDLAVPQTAPRIEPQAMPTVTLAEIYAAQGHPKRAIETLKRVLEREPEHLAAQALLAKLEDTHYVPPSPALPPEPEVEAAPAFADEEAETEVAVPLVPLVAPPEPAGAEAYISGPSYSDEGAEFQLAPESAAETAPTQESPTGKPTGHAYAIVAAADKDVDALAITGTVPLLPVVEDPPECIAIPMSGRRTYVRWRVSFTAIGTQLGQRPQGRLVVRAHVVVPSWDGPSVEIRDLPVAADAEDVVLEALPEPSVVRVAIGWCDGSDFVPFAHSPALSLLADRGLVIWTTSGLVPVVLDDPRAAPFARALEAARLAS